MCFSILIQLFSIDLDTCDQLHTENFLSLYVASSFDCEYPYQLVHTMQFAQNFHHMMKHLLDLMKIYQTNKKL